MQSWEPGSPRFLAVTHVQLILTVEVQRTADPVRAATHISVATNRCAGRPAIYSQDTSPSHLPTHRYTPMVPVATGKMAVFSHCLPRPVVVLMRVIFSILNLSDQEKEYQVCIGCFRW